MNSTEQIPIHRCTAVVVGTGAAGYNAALCLKSHGVEDILIVSEGRCCGTSRNTGSDKQSYYKISQNGAQLDSVQAMAQTLFDGGSMHGDIALVHAALSARSFYKLVELGVPFPHNIFGEYVGYQTNDNGARRTTSAGPLTSKAMTEALEQRAHDIPLLDGYRVARILTDGDICIGLLLVSVTTGDFALINASAVVLATGGPAHIYGRCAYPESQTGATGAALCAGAIGANLGEWQYGLASTEVRWSVSGSYQQVLPRYISTKKDGSDEREFLLEYYENASNLLHNIFLKGHRQTFDAHKTDGPSRIDLLVYREMFERGRIVSLDFSRNPSCIGDTLTPDCPHLENEVREYLAKAGALFGTPVERLAHINPFAIEVYASNNIDLYQQPLTIAVCAQYCNGGLATNHWFESNLARLFPVGEAAGSFGANLPDGAALAATQVESLRAAQYIAARYSAPPPDDNTFLSLAHTQVDHECLRCAQMLGKGGDAEMQRLRLQSRMDRHAGSYRSRKGLVGLLEQIKDELERVQCKRPYELAQAYRNRDIAFTQLACVSAMLAHIELGGASRGSYLIDGQPASEDSLRNYVLQTKLNEQTLKCHNEKIEVRPLVPEDAQFESVWHDFQEKRIYEQANKQEISK